MAQRFVASVLKQNCAYVAMQIVAIECEQWSKCKKMRPNTLEVLP